MAEERIQKGAEQRTAFVISRPVRHWLLGLIDIRKQWELASAVRGCDWRGFAGLESTLEGFVAFIFSFLTLLNQSLNITSTSTLKIGWISYGSAAA